MPIVSVRAAIAIGRLRNAEQSAVKRCGGARRRRGGAPTAREWRERRHAHRGHRDTCTVTQGCGSGEDTRTPL